MQTKSLLKKWLTYTIVILFVGTSFTIVAAPSSLTFTKTKAVRGVHQSLRDEKELKYYNPNTLTQVIGIYGGALPHVWQSAIRLTQTELSPYNTWTITKVVVGFGEDPNEGPMNVTIFIYDKGTSTHPGNVIVNDTSVILTGTDLITVPLTTPVSLVGHNELWVAVQWTQNVDATHYAFVDTGPAIDEKGDWVFLNNAWLELQSAGIDSNWAIGAVLDNHTNPLIANFIYAPFHPINTSIIHFTDTSTDSNGTIISWSWDFGDQNTSNLQNPDHCYYHDGTYTVSLTVTDNHSTTDSIQKNITVYTPPNHPPNVPTNPVPINGALTIPIDTTLSWTGGDPDSGDTITYDVYFGTTSAPTKVTANQSGTTYNPGTLVYGTTYYWKIVAWDNHGAMTTGPIWNFKTNSLPNVPSNPSPQDHATGVSANTVVTWTGGDPDPSDTVLYDVYFGVTNPPPKVTSNQSGTSHNPGVLNYGTTYYWKIISWDNHGASTAGPVWDFTTEFDTTPPTTTILFQGTLGDNRWYVTDVIVSFNATDTQSGVSSTFYSIDNGAWINYTTPFMMTTDGNYSIAYFSIDNIGNVETPKTAILKIDQFPPMTNHTFIGIMGSNDWFLNFSFSLNAFDATSGVNHTYYKLRGADPWTIYTGPVINIADGTYELYYCSVDKAGNIEMQKGPFAFKVDMTPPSITLTATPENLQKTKWLLNATVSDATSGVNRVEFFVDNQSLGNVSSPPYILNYVGSGKVAYAIAYDNAGNSMMSHHVNCQDLQLQSSNELLYLNKCSAIIKLVNTS